MGYCSFKETRAKEDVFEIIVALPGTLLLKYKKTVQVLQEAITKILHYILNGKGKK